MTNNNINKSNTNEGKINLLNYLMILVKYRRFLLLNTLSVCLLVGLVSFFLPSWYNAHTSILPPETDTSFMGLSSSLLGGFTPPVEMSLPFMATPSDVIGTILQSRSVAERIVERAGLMEVYNTQSKEEAIKALASHTKVMVSEEGLVYLNFEDKDRNKAALVANLYIEELDRINRMANSSRARNTRLFIEQRMEKTQKDLIQAEEDLRGFQEEHKTISLDEQMKTAIQAAADLKAEMLLNEIELNVLSQNLSPSHPQIQQLKTRISQIGKQLEKLQFGDQNTSSEKDKILDVPFSEVPKLGLELARLTRDLKIQEAIFELLSSQYEQAKIQEAKDTPTIQVLDRAVPPEKRSRPKRAMMVILAGIASLFVGIVFAFGLEYLQATRKRNPEEFRKIEQLLSTFKEDVLDIKRLFFKSKS
jgi:uncharacterized protein involved in exopolysaccharide biosynthesis